MICNNFISVLKLITILAEICTLCDRIQADSELKNVMFHTGMKLYVQCRLKGADDIDLASGPQFRRRPQSLGRRNKT
jgi:hypothetical protein